MTFTLKQYIEERVAAWEECKNCSGAGKEPKGYIGGDEEAYGYKTCYDCNGKGGRWHPDVDIVEYAYTGGIVDITPERYKITKSSYLVREHRVCSICGDRWTKNRPCGYCQNTGIEPDTAEAWRVDDKD